MLGGKAFGYRSIFPSNYPRFFFIVFNSSNRVRFVESNEIVRKREREREKSSFFLFRIALDSILIKIDRDKNRYYPGQASRWNIWIIPSLASIAYGWFKENRSVILVRNFLWSNDFYVLVYVSSEENCFIRKRVDDDRILLISSMLFHGFSLDLRLSSNGFVLLSSPHSLYSFYSTPFYISSSFFFFFHSRFHFLDRISKDDVFTERSIVRRNRSDRWTLIISYQFTAYRVINSSDLGNDLPPVSRHLYFYFFFLFFLYSWSDFIIVVIIPHIEFSAYR